MPDTAAPTDALPALAAALLAVDPAGLGGVVVRALSHAALDRWARGMVGALPTGMPVRRVPPGTSDDRLAGGLDLAATLAAGRPVAERGILGAADGGVVIVPSAERIEQTVAGRLIAALDSGECAVERDGISLRAPARIAAVLLDESADDEAGPPAALLDRLALHVVLPPSGIFDLHLPTSDEIAAARDLLPSVTVDEDIVRAACLAAVAFGIDSLRAPLFAVRAARVLAALAGETSVDAGLLATAAALVLAPRATRLPPSPDDAPDPDDADPPPSTNDEAGDEDRREPSSAEMEEMLVRAVAAALPPGLLERLESGRAARVAGRTGERSRSPVHGRRIGVRAGDPRRRRLDVLATVRAAAPWQRVRGRSESAGGRLEVRSGDFRVRVLERRTGVTTVFVVDASGSAALHRLGEAKGAVELLLAESYVRRDRVALVTFRRASAELALPPTRSLARARRLLSGLPGGGGTPLAAAADAALAVAEGVRRGGSSPVLVFLTDGRANVARDGAGGRERAEVEAIASARAIRAAAVPALFIDTGVRPGDFARRFAAEMGARHLPLPMAGAREVGAAVRAASADLVPA
ncbi:MAG TPA: magnesium chelatase subunit D [Longimicrobium sp.]|nr:magnesium chelatase subunit D [Longimicrobium sp.]